MSKDKISDYSSTANSNTDIAAINIDEGCAPSGINNAIRALMAQLKNFQTGASGDSFNGPVGSITPAAGAFTTLSASSTLSVTGAGTIQGLTVGKGAGAVSSNTAVGASALASGSLSGGLNTAVGYVSLNGNTTGANNSGFGYGTLSSNTTGASNVAVGTYALNNNTTASSNTAVGYQAGYSNTTGTRITAIGAYSLNVNTTGASNTATGRSALSSNTTGNYNTAVGDDALSYNTTASNNTAVGYQAGYSNTTAADNTYIGRYAGYSGTTGYSNTFVGKNAGYGVTTGAGNTFIGSNADGTGAGQSVTTGSKNTIIGGFIGNAGGLNITTASNYIVLSDGDGNPRGIFDGSGNYIVGAATTSLISTNTAGTVIKAAGGVQLMQTANTSDWGIKATSGSICNFYSWNGSAAVLAGSISVNGNATTYGSVSDYRLKTFVAKVTNSGERIDALNPIEFEWKSDGKRTRGFFAHEFQNVYADSVTGTKDAVNDNGDPVYQQMQGSANEVIADLVAEIQSLRKRLAVAGIA